MLILRRLSYVPNLVQISLIVTEINSLFVPEVHSMTSIELTSRFDYWSRSSPNGSDASFYQMWYIQSGHIDIFRNSIWRPPPSWISMISNLVCFGMMIDWWLSYVPNLVQISLILTHFRSCSSFNDVIRINFRIRFLVISSSLLPRCIFPLICCKYFHPLQIILAFTKFKMASVRHFGFVRKAIGPPTKSYSWCVPPVKILSWLAQ